MIPIVIIILIIIVFLAIGSIECQTPLCRFLGAKFQRLKTWCKSLRLPWI